MTPAEFQASRHRVVIVTGARAWPDYMVVWRTLALYQPSVVVHGACSSGVDDMAERWCKRMGVDYHGMPANWEPDGRLDRAAGHKRNRRMLEHYPGELVLAFPYGPSPGTRGCIRAALDLGHPLVVFDANGESSSSPPATSPAGSGSPESSG